MGAPDTPPRAGGRVVGNARALDDVVAQVLDYAIIALDLDGTIESWNLGAQRVKGYTAEEAIGRSFTMFYPEEDRRAGLPEQLLAEALRLGHVERTGWRVRKDGSRFWADVVITALHDDEGRHTGYAKITRDLTEQHDLQTRLHASEERLRLLVGQVVDYAIIALDPKGRVETWNLGAERLKGYTAEEAVGRSFAIFYTEKDRVAGLPETLLAQAREHGRVVHSGWRVRKNGTRFWGDVVITALHDEEGTLTGFAKVTRDRSDLKALEEAQDAFYAAFTHDFRTPVAGLMGYVDALRMATDDRERETYIDRVEANAQRLLTMVDGLVRFASQRAAQASMSSRDVDVADVARSTVRDLPLTLVPDRIEVVGSFTLAHVDRDALHRVLTNLVVNALKYSPAQSPVRVTVATSPQGRPRVSVSDRGRGIDPDDIPTIFDRGARGRLSEDDGGTGLGLASVRDLVEQLGGSVHLESELGAGTTVTVELPPGEDPT